MAHEKALAQALDSLWNKSSERNWILGRLGLPGGFAVFDVPDKPGYKYVNKGAEGELGQVIARDRIGVANILYQRVRMRYEFGEYVIRDAEQIAGGSGGGGASNLNALTDVTLTTPANGNVLSYNSATSQWINVVPAGGASGAPSPHAHSSVHHTGLLPWTELNKSGSSLNEIATRPHSMLTGIAPDDHHNQAHVLATGTALGPDHTISGAVAGEVLRALSATTAAFDVLHHTDLDTILPDQHHERAHNIISGDSSGTVHTITGSQFQVVGATATNVLGLLTPSFAPGAAAAILRTDSSGAIQLDTNLFYVDGANNWIGINRTPSGATLDLIAYSNADHTQRIQQKSGQTGRMWRIEDLSGNELIVLDSVGNLQSGRPGFVSGLRGWQITPGGNAEFNNIWARGELHATVFVKDEVHATGGTFMVATAATLHDDAVIDSTTVDDDVLVVYSTPAGQGVPLQVVTTSGTFVGNELHVSWLRNVININDPPSGPAFYFQPGDIVRVKTEIEKPVPPSTLRLADVWLQVNGAVQNDGYATYSVTKMSGSDCTIPKGTALISWGKEGDGRILMTSDWRSDEGYSPYIDIFTSGAHPWDADDPLGIIPRMRMGQLKGIGLPGVSGVSQWGMIAGQNLADANTGYLIASNLQFSLYKVDIRLNDGVSDTGQWTANGNLKIGKNIGTAATTGMQFDAVTGDLIIGNPAGTPTPHFLRWNQSTGKLTVAGDLIVSDPGTTVTFETMTNADNAVRSDAATDATTKTDAAKVYGDARRIVGVTGSWDSPTQTTIRWGTKAVAGTPASVAMSAAFGNNTNRSIADHAGTSVSVTSRTYLYVSVAGSGTMTMTPTVSLATVMASPNNVLIAVCDPGDINTKACSITVVAGSTYISGSNIFTGSITSSQIAALTITAGNIAANTITANKLVAGTITSTYLDPAVNTSISSADAKGQQGINDAAAVQTSADAYFDYANQRRMLGVSGTWTSLDANTITWSALTARFASGGTRTITASPAAPTGVTLSPAGRWYLYVDVSAGSGTMAMETPTQSLASLGGNDVLIAVVDTGTVGSTPKASINIVAGSTYISGDNIMTGTIVANRIAARTITTNELAAKSVTSTEIDVVNLAAVSTLTGALSVTGNIDVATTGAIRGNSKAYGSSTPGFFLGYSSPYYRFDVGDGNNYLRWTGTQLLLKTEWALEMGTDFNGAAIIITNPVSGRQGFVTYDNSGNHAFNFTDAVWAGSFLATGTVEGTQLRAVSVAANSTPIWIQGSGGSDTFSYNSIGTRVLTYSGAMTVGGAFTAAGQVVTSGNSIRIATNSSPANSGAAGSVGEIRWDDGWLYIRNNNGWRRIPTGNAF